MRFLRASSAIAGGAIAVTSFSALAPRAETPKVRFSVTYGAVREPRAARRPAPAAHLQGPEPKSRACRSPTTCSKSQQVFGIDVDGWKAGAGRGLRGRRPRLSRCESLAELPAGDVPRPGAAPPLRDLPPRRRPRREAADGPRRGPAVEPGARQPLLDAARGRARPGEAPRRSRSRSTR